MLIALIASLAAPATSDLPMFRAPAGQNYAVVEAGGQTILPNGRFVTPVGRRLYGGEDCWNVVPSPDGTKFALMHQAGVTVFSELRSQKPTKTQLNQKEHAFCAAWFKDGQRIIVSDGDEGEAIIKSVETGKTLVSIAVDEAKSKDKSYLNDIVLSPDERTAYAVDIAHQDLLVLDLVGGKLVSRTAAGRQPYALARSGSQIFVANIGVFDYSSFQGTPQISGEKAKGFTRPPFGFPSPESANGTLFEGRKVPGLGEPNSPDGHSLWIYNLAQGKPALARKMNTGLLIQAPADGGKAVGASGPCAILVHGGLVYVANSNNDTVQAFDQQTLALRRTIKLTASPELSRYRGLIPCGLAIDDTRHRLYICEAGINAVAVYDLKQEKVIGQIPTGWWPSSVRILPGGEQIVVSCQKGIGRGPRGPKLIRKPDDERFGLSDMPGFAELIDTPADGAPLAAMTKLVLQNNGFVPLTPAEIASLPASPIPTEPGKPSDEIKYVVFITKENHTFDGIFGGLNGARGEADYAEFGRQGWLREKGKKQRVAIMPNHINLAEQFSISDNFYMEPQASGDGHRWLIGVYPSLWTTRVFYSGWNFADNDKAKGRFTSFGSNGSQLPEDYLENGSMWEHFERSKVTYRNYGEGFEFPGCLEDGDAPRPGAWQVANYPISQSLWNNTCWNFPIFNTNIPDIARVDWFKEDLENNYRKVGKPIPQFMNITLCNDHGTEARPKDGYPFVASYMADNDLALGRLVDYLSHQPEWKNMAVFVTQDDSGGDNDIVDRHRSYVLALGPYAKRNYVSHDHTSIMSILKTIYLIFGLGPNNLHDAVATDLRDMFTMTPNLAPYTFEQSDPRVFVPEDAYKPSDLKWKSRKNFMQPSVKMDDPKFIDWMRNRKTVGERD